MLIDCFKVYSGTSAFMLPPLITLKAIITPLFGNLCLFCHLRLPEALLPNLVDLCLYLALDLKKSKLTSQGDKRYGVTLGQNETIASTKPGTIGLCNDFV